MKEIKKEELPQEVFELYDDYAHDRLDRRSFIQNLSLYAVGGITVASLMSFLMPDYIEAILTKKRKADSALRYVTMAQGESYSPPLPRLLRRDSSDLGRN